MNSIESLLRVSPPLLAYVGGTERIAEEFSGWIDSGLTARFIRGAKSRTRQAFFDEVAAALQFPRHFGENWNAFSDCIADLQWLPFRQGFALLVYEADEFLSDTDPVDLRMFIQSISDAATEFAAPIHDGEWWDRDPVPFHVVLHVESTQALTRWRPSWDGALIK